MKNALLLFVLCTSSCAHSGSFVWIDQVPDTLLPKDDGYQITAGDLVNIQVFNQDKMSARVRVRSDGRVSLPLLNDVDASGRTPAMLAQELAVRLKEFILNPSVTVTVEESRPLSISVVGEAARPGLYPLDSGAGVLQALASAGGLTEYASRDRIFVLRKIAGEQVKPPTRIRFNYDSLVRAEGRAAAFRLQSGDVVVVE